MEFRALTHFLTVIETGSFSAAAQVLGLTQPGLSKSIRGIENHYGVKLFDRVARGVRPTTFGRRLAYHAALIRAEYENADAEMAALAGGHQGTVRIGAGPTWMRSFLPEAVARVLRRMPKVEILILGGLNDSLFASLRQGDFDMVVAPRLSDDSGTKEFSHKPLMTMTLRVISRVDHPLQEKADISPRDLLDYPWILPGADAQLRQALEILFRRHGLPAPRPAIVSVSTAFSMSVLRQDDFLSFQVIQAFKDADTEDVTALKLPDFLWHRPVGVSYRAGASISPVVRLLIQELESVCAAES
ncbi:MAG: LysR family transcriptional regulator [Inquilinaceae bacterium]